VTVAACERSFSKLKLIKTYLLSFMSNERLNSMALLSIGNATAQKVDMSESIKRFADMKPRKNNFYICFEQDCNCIHVSYLYP
jgi:hypothetical protein